jgi:pimeloyl-ACP methyl ester carboxylesterase
MTQASATQQGREQADDKNAIRPFHVMFQRRNSPNCAGASRRRNGLNEKRSWMHRKAYSSRRFRNSRGPDRIARAWVTLMKRLGYTKFVAQGGDWGAVVVDQMGVQAPPELLGIHTNMPGIFPNDIDKAAFSGAPAPRGAGQSRRIPN